MQFNKLLCWIFLSIILNIKFIQQANKKLIMNKQKKTVPLKYFSTVCKDILFKYVFFGLLQLGEIEGMGIFLNKL